MVDFPNLTPEAYAQIFRNRNPSDQPVNPLTNQYQTVVDAANRYGISPSLLAAVMAHETASGQYQPWRPGGGYIYNNNNPGGLMGANRDPTQPYSYPTIEAGIEATARTVRNLYNRGGQTIAGMRELYAPPRVRNDPRNLNQYWVRGVEGFLGRIGNPVPNDLDVQYPNATPEERRNFVYGFPVNEAIPVDAFEQSGWSAPAPDDVSNWRPTDETWVPGDTGQEVGPNTGLAVPPLTDTNWGFPTDSRPAPTGTNWGFPDAPGGSDTFYRGSGIDQTDLGGGPAVGPNSDDLSDWTPAPGAWGSGAYGPAYGRALQQMGQGQGYTWNDAAGNWGTFGQPEVNTPFGGGELSPSYWGAPNTYGAPPSGNLGSWFPGGHGGGWTPPDYNPGPVADPAFGGIDFGANWWNTTGGNWGHNPSANTWGLATQLDPRVGSIFGPGGVGHTGYAGGFPSAVPPPDDPGGGTYMEISIDNPFPTPPGGYGSMQPAPASLIDPKGGISPLHNNTPIAPGGWNYNGTGNLVPIGGGPNIGGPWAGWDMNFVLR